MGVVLAVFFVCQHKAGPTTVEAVQALMTAVFFGFFCWHHGEREVQFSLKKNLNASRPFEHPPVRGKNVKTFRWGYRLQRQNLFIALKRVPRWLTLGQQCNVGDKPTVILYTYINRHTETPNKTKRKQCST